MFAGNVPTSQSLLVAQMMTMHLSTKAQREADEEDKEKETALRQMTLLAKNSKLQTTLQETSKGFLA